MRPPRALAIISANIVIVIGPDGSSCFLCHANVLLNHCQEELQSPVPLNKILPIYATDELIAEVLFGKERGDFDWKTLFRQLERDGFPPKRAIFGDRRHLPAVIAFCARREMGELDLPLAVARELAPEDGLEEFDLWLLLDLSRESASVH